MNTTVSNPGRCLVSAASGSRLLLLFSLLAVCSLCYGRVGTTRTVTVSNPTAQQRQEVVELKLGELKDSLTANPMLHAVMRNSLGQAVVTQLTPYGTLLFEASVRPLSTSSYTLELTTASVPVQGGPWAYGGYYPNRADDLTWENDRVAFRAYGPALQRSGEQAFGYDVWSKSTPQMVVDQRYQQHMYGENLRWAYHKIGRRAESDSIVRATSFHYDHGQGLDAYGVGPSLGCGGSAVMEGDSLRMSYCWHSYQIQENGPLRFSVLLKYYDKLLPAATTENETRYISLTKGSWFCQCVVYFENRTAPVDVAAGVVLHRSDTTQLDMQPNSILYADPTDRPEQLGQQVYVGVLFPFDEVKTRVVPAALTAAPHQMKGQLKMPAEVAGNAVGVSRLKDKNALWYYFGSAWSGGTIRTFEQWKQLAKDQLNALQHPLEVKMLER